MKKARIAAAVSAALAVCPTEAVQLSSDGFGQALIFPYYTARTAAGGNALNTYISIANATSDAKAVLVRLREGRNAREVASFNLYLSPNDLWTAAVVPTPDGASLVTADNSCTDPPVAGGNGMGLSASRYTGANADGYGDTLDRTREGYIEMIEMATLTGQSRADVIHNSAGVVPGCAAMRTNLSPSVAAPSGGLYGSLTFINVNNGQDFMVEPTVLDRLATRPFFARPGTPGPDFNAPEIDPVSVVVDGRYIYRGRWNRPVDAVSAVLMRSALLGEYVLETNTASQTDVVVTMPTRQHYVDGQPQVFVAPFAARTKWSPACNETAASGEPMTATYANRESRMATYPSMTHCAAAAVATVHNYGSENAPGDRTRVLGSTTRALFEGAIGVTVGFAGGWVQLAPSSTGQVPLTSLPQSTRHDLSTGTSTTGVQAYAGLPMIGFVVRTFANGTLTCSGAGACQGNYGGAFPFKYRTDIRLP